MVWVARARVLVLALALGAVSRQAGAASPEAGESSRFRLMYEATPDSCPNAPAFLGAIRARTERPRLASPGEEAPTIAVSITGKPDRVLGRLEIHELDGARQERTVEGRSCPEVAKALALVVALYLDPDAVSGPEPPAPSQPAPTAPSTAPQTTARAEPPPPALPRPERGLRLGVGASAGALGGLGPSLASLAGLFLDVAAATTHLPSWFRPSARMVLAVATTGAEVGFGTQRYALVAGGLRICPVGVPLPERLRVAPCAGLLAGVHRGTISGIPNSQAQNEPWVTPATTLALGWEVSRLITLELEGGALWPLVRTRFFLAPDLTLFRAPPVAGTAQFAVLVRFR
jgi:hypothetical protein